MAGKAVALDPGSHTWKLLALKEGKGGLAVTRFAAIKPADGGEMARLGIPLKGIVAGLAGRDMTLRYTQVPPSPDWQLRNLMELEIADISSQSGGDLSADYNLLPVGEDADVDTVLLALARNDALEQTSSVVSESRGSIAAHVPNCIALYNAYLRTSPIEDEEQVVCLASIGRETMDIALVRGQELLFARNLTGGTKVLDDAIASAFDVSARKAERLKRDLLDLDPASRGHFASGQAEKVTMAAGGAASVFVSAIQSSLAFCQSQTKIEGLRLDKVLLAGGGAKLRGLRGLMREAIRCPVEVFDPFETVDLSQLPQAEAEQLEQMRTDAAVALGLAISAIDSEVYSLEILPEAVKKRQRFTQRTVFNIGAGVIAAGLLGLGAVNSKDRLEKAESTQRTVLSQKNRAERTNNETLELVEENQLRRDIGEILADKAIPLNGVLRTMRVINATLPPELWITSVEIKKRDKRGSDNPIVEVKGAGRPVHGADVGAIYAEFSVRFREQMAPAKVFPRVDENSPDLTKFTLAIDFLPPPEPSADEDQDNGGGN